MLSDQAAVSSIYAWLIPSLLGVLSFASMVGLVLKQTVARGQPHAVIDNLNSRNKAWWMMLALCIGAFLAGKPGVITLCAVLSFLSLREFLSLTGRRTGDHTVLASLFYLVLPLQYLWVWLGLEWMALLFIPVLGMTLLPVAMLVGNEPRGYLDQLTRTQWGLMACVYGLSHVAALLGLPASGMADRQVLLAIFLVLVLQLGDVFQFVFGKLLGRHLVAPSLSPSKTVEGLLGGLLCSALLGMLLSGLTPWAPWQSGLLGLVLALMGFASGLVMSAIKRDQGAKDWGASISGHGGVLDRIDSIVLSAPFFYHLARWDWLG